MERERELFSVHLQSLHTQAHTHRHTHLHTHRHTHLHTQVHTCRHTHTLGFDLVLTDVSLLSSYY